MINWTFRKLTISTLIKVTIYIHGCWNFILNTLYTWRCCHGYRFTIHGRLGEEDPQHEVLLVRGCWYVRKRKENGRGRTCDDPIHHGPRPSYQCWDYEFICFLFLKN